MRPTQAHARPRPLAVVLLAAAALAAAILLLVVTAPGAVARAPATLKVSTAQNATLGKRILVTTSGRTLYTLSAETRGRFICTGECLPTWPPLTLKAGVRPAGVRGLGTIRRPDGRRQATYQGRPLYRFSGDSKKGDVEGEGFMDVGTWHAAVAP